MTQYDEIIEVKNKIDEYEKQLTHLKSELTELKKSHWSFSGDEQRYGDLILECNKGSWKEVKYKNIKDKIFYVAEVEELHSDACVAFGLEEAKMLVNYLNEKIEFLETE